MGHDPCWASVSSSVNAARAAQNTECLIRTGPAPEPTAFTFPVSWQKREANGPMEAKRLLTWRTSQF